MPHSEKTVEAIEDYVRKWHEVRYSKLPIEIVKVKDMKTVDIIKNVAHEWEKRTRLELEFDIYNEIYQKDVNNYIIISEDGHYKSKGAYLKKLSPIDNDLPIINTALIEYFVHQTPIEDTINQSNKSIFDIVDSI